MPCFTHNRSFIFPIAYCLCSLLVCCQPLDTKTGAELTRPSCGSISLFHYSISNELYCYDAGREDHLDFDSAVSEQKVVAGDVCLEPGAADTLIRLQIDRSVFGQTDESGKLLEVKCAGCCTGDLTLGTIERQNSSGRIVEVSFKCEGEEYWHNEYCILVSYNVSVPFRTSLSWNKLEHYKDGSLLVVVYEQSDSCNCKRQYFG